MKHVLIYHLIQSVHQCCLFFRNERVRFQSSWANFPLYWLDPKEPGSTLCGRFCITLFRGPTVSMELFLRTCSNLVLEHRLRRAVTSLSSDWSIDVGVSQSDAARNSIARVHFLVLSGIEPPAFSVLQQHLTILKISWVPNYNLCNSEVCGENVREQRIHHQINPWMGPLKWMDPATCGLISSGTQLSWIIFPKSVNPKISVDKISG